MKTTDKLALAMTLALLLPGIPSLAQVHVGDNLTMSGGATLSAGYTGNSGNLPSASDHGITWGGNGTINGSYFNPKFFSFNVTPYYNQSRENSSFQSISNSSGVAATAAIFSGSRFPGSISYSKSYDSSGNFAVPGVADYTTHGNSDAFDIGWEMNLDDLPSVSFNFLEGKTAYSVYGTNSDSSSTFHAFNTHSTYRIAGFSLFGGFNTSASQSEAPQFLTGQTPEKSESDGHSYSFGVSHALPLAGNVSTNFNRSIITSGFGGSKSNGTLDSLSANAGFSPFPRFNFGVNANYTDNLAATLQQTLLAGGTLVPIDISQKSNSLDISGYTSYSIPAIHLTLTGSADHRAQTFGGAANGSESYTGSVSHFRSLLGGHLNVSVGVNRNTLDSTGDSTTGLLANVGYTRRFAAWEVSGSFNYSKSAETLLVGYTNSSYGYSGSVSRKIRKGLSWTANAGGSKSDANGITGSSSDTQFYSTSLSTRWLSGSTNYSKSSGNSILTGSGLISAPTNIPVQTLGQLILYGGHSYGFGLGSAPRRGLSLAANYSKSFTNTLGGTTNSNNTVENLNTTLQYKFRKMWFNAGYSRLSQGFSATGAPVTLNSYFIGVSRWFNIF